MEFKKIDPLFVDASGMVGKTLEIQGYLRWMPENRNLFPLGTKRSSMSSAYCLPILIRYSNEKLIDVAKGLDGANVIVDGSIVTVAQPGMDSIFSCKPVGIEVTSIRKK